MKTINSENNLKIAESYYSSMLEKRFDDMTACLHDDIDFISPMAEMQGKEAVSLSAIGLSQTLESIEIRSKFCEGNNVMLVYDFFFSMPKIKLRSAALMDFKDDKISKIELFFDTKPFAG